MEILKTLVSLIEGGALHAADTIRYEGGLWIVLTWSKSQTEELVMPTRIIRMDTLRHLACTRFRRHRVRCFYGTGGESWRDGSLPESSSLKLFG
jgi:hypothetical protein